MPLQRIVTCLAFIVLAGCSSSSRNCDIRQGEACADGRIDVAPQCTATAGCTLAGQPYVYDGSAPKLGGGATLHAPLGSVASEFALVAVDVVPSATMPTAVTAKLNGTGDLVQTMSMVDGGSATRFLFRVFPPGGAATVDVTLTGTGSWTTSVRLISASHQCEVCS